MQIVSKETICMKCQILFSGKNKKNIINLSPGENAQRVVKVNLTCYMTSPHGKDVGEQVCPSVHPFVMLLAMLTKSVGICHGVPSTF